MMVDQLYHDMERRIAASPPGLCPVDMAMNFLNLCHAQTCGKCVPCRVGLGQLSILLGDVLEGRAKPRHMEFIEETAQSIASTAACAIGRHAAQLVLDGVRGFADDYWEHIHNHRCLGNLENPVPCVALCPAGIDIPGYIALISAGRCEDAIRLIRKDNPFPVACAYICEHPCEARCRRNMIDDAMNIRGLKRYAVDTAGDVAQPLCAAPTGKRVAVIGGGPAGLSAAFLLGRAGVSTTVFERRDTLGGIVRHVIPAFRIEDEAIEQDIALCKAVGVEFRLNTEITSAQSLFDQGYTHVIFATGAWEKGDPGLSYGEAMNVLDFLEGAKKAPETLKLGAHVVVIGGGNTAMDAARAAKRIPGVADVTLVYRRTLRYMPADQEELELALADGVLFQELLAPVGVKDGVLTCKVMELGAPDASGRRSPVETGRTLELPADTVITAIGERVNTALYQANGLEVDGRGRPVVNRDTLESSVRRVFVIGDGQSGPGAVVEAIAGASKAAGAIAALDLDRCAEENHKAERYPALLGKRGDVCTDCASCEDMRCLGCATVCETCASVCPNRANVPVWVPGMRMRQIIHVDGMCNECGNCAVFCPYDSRPYQEKLTLFWSPADFANSQNPGFLRLEDGKTRVRLGESVGDYDVSDPGCGLYEDLRRTICAVYEHYRYLLG